MSATSSFVEFYRVISSGVYVGVCKYSYSLFCRTTDSLAPVASPPTPPMPVLEDDGDDDGDPQQQAARDVGVAIARPSVIMPGTRRPRKKNDQGEPADIAQLAENAQVFREAVLEYCNRPDSDPLPPKRALSDACDTELFLLSLLPSLKALSDDDRDNCKLEIQKLVISFKQKKHHSQTGRGGSRAFTTPTGTPRLRSSNSSPAGGFGMMSPPLSQTAFGSNSNLAGTPMATPIASPPQPICPSPIQLQTQFDAWNGTTSNAYGFSTLLNE